MSNCILDRIVSILEGNNLKNGALHRICILQGLLILVFTSGCVQPEEVPNLDHLVGKKFSESVYMGRKVYKQAFETANFEELFEEKDNGCKLYFGVRKLDDVIIYWRIDPSIETCRSRKIPLNM